MEPSYQIRVICIHLCKHISVSMEKCNVGTSTLLYKQLLIAFHKFDPLAKVTSELSLHLMRFTGQNTNTRLLMTPAVKGIHKVP